MAERKEVENGMASVDHLSGGEDGNEEESKDEEGKDGKDKDDKAKEEEDKRGKKVRYGNIIMNVFVLYTYNASIMVHQLVIQQYLYRRVTADLFRNATLNININMSASAATMSVCYINKSEPGYKLQQDAQSLASYKQMNYTLVSTCIGLLTILIIGSYADRIPRKVLYLLPIIGTFCKNLPMVFIIWYEFDTDYFYIGEVVQGLLGTAFVSGFAGSTYTAENTPPRRSRTIALAMQQLATLFVIGSGAGTGYFIGAVGFFYPELTSILLDVVSVFVVVVFMEETLPKSFNKSTKCIAPWTAVKKMLGFYLFEGSRRKRVIYCLGIFSMFLKELSDLGISNTDTLFWMNQPFCWPSEKIGVFMMILAGLKQVVGLPLLAILQRVVSDQTIVVLSVLSLFGSHLLQAFAYNDAMMYGVAAVGVFSMAGNPAMASILSRLTTIDRQGSFFASMAFVSLVTLAVGTPLFSSIYQDTVSIFRGGAYVAMAAVDFSSLLVIILFMRLVSTSEEFKQLKVN